jgi:hypothetical protein
MEPRCYSDFYDFSSVRTVGAVPQFVTLGGCAGKQSVRRSSVHSSLRLFELIL